ncbi:deleted in malignant brain tumors 1 protein-like [Octopus vulgaris]|uniref:Deleted in malignant brain tumors 1 protein-like n=1 Tax=Octopus vulgaris TaxID=6645 RepID=A0AA36F3F7_OCTVU|nr:deleted in malignant brain tumors 1 protein-like [Octopus vulgaris]
MPLTYLVAVIFLVSSYDVSSVSLPQKIVRHELKGRAEIFHNGSWGTICDDSWNNASSTVFCRMLGYSSGVSIINTLTVDGQGKIILDEVTCSGPELSLDSCSHNAWGNHDCQHSEDTGVHCTAQLFRISEASTVGAAEVYYKGKWMTLSDSNWNDIDAQVFCKSVGYRSGKTHRNPRVGNNYFLHSDIQCTGSENNIMQCFKSRSQNFTRNQASVAGVDCEEARVRVIEKNIFGRAEVFYRNIWGTVCDDGWQTSESKVFCRSMGYSDGDYVVYSLTEDGTGNIWLDDVNCNGNEKRIVDCSHSALGTHNCGHNEDTGVNCTIVPKRFISNGHAEVFYNGEWGGICDNNWNIENTIIFCQELGYTSGITLEGSTSKYSTKTWLQNVQCSGRESYIDQCSHSDWTDQICPTNSYVRISCSPNSVYRTHRLGVSLSEGTKGTVNITISGIKSILAMRSMPNHIAEALCKTKGFSTGTTLEYINFPTSPKLSCIDLIAMFNDTWIINYQPCGYGGAYVPFIRCANEIYRVIGKNENEGRLEVNINGVWGNLCSTSWNNTGAKLACNALGFQTGISVPGRNFPSSITKTWMKNITCTLQSKSISDCKHNLVDQQTCLASELVGVRCFNVKVRFPSSGRVEVQYDGIWGRIKGTATRNECSVICRMLGNTCSSYSGYGSSGKRLAINSMKCHGNESVLTDCNIQWTNATSTNYEFYIRCHEENVRFRNAATHHGVVEIFHDNKWGGICGKSWTRNDAIVACRSMGYMSGYIYDYKHHLREHGFLSDTNCNGNEQNLRGCPHGIWGFHRCNKWAGAECSKYKVQLRGGNSPKEGRVEIFQNGMWGTVCDRNWNDEAASVICRSLGYNQGISYGGWKFGQGRGTIWFDDVTCNGDETFIDHCAKKPWSDKMACNHSCDAGVVCLEKGIRLVDGESEKEGRVEIFQTHRWGNLCGDYWNNNNAMVVCRMLGHMYGIGYQIRKNVFFQPTRSSLLIQTPLNCNGNESSIFDCPVFASTRCHFPGAYVICADVGVRLVDKISDNAGSIEVLLENEWRSICPYSWEENAAFVICNMLGFEDGFGLSNLPTPQLPRMINNLKCDGTEHAIDECSYELTGPNSCNSNNVGVFCTMVEMRINNTVPNSSFGYLEILYNGIWGSVCNTSWSNSNAAVVCQSLGYRQGKTFPNSRLLLTSRGKHQSWIDNVRCHGNESSILSCKHSNFGHAFCRFDNSATVNCTNYVGVRLQDGRNSSEGRVEVEYKGVWGTVCFDDWDDTSATVACKMLGYRYGRATETNIFLPSKKPIWLNRVKCRGMESSLFDCPHAPWKWNHCSHRHEAGAICHNGSPPTMPNRRTIIG